MSELKLDTAAGASWKPLPVIVTTAFSVFGGAAPVLWLLVARAGGLLALALAYRLAARRGGAAAGTVAACALLLTPGADGRWFYYVGHGLSEPLLAALALGAIDRHLAGRRTQALLLGFLAALARPEAWPFLGLYAMLLWRGERARRPVVLALLALVPLLWLGGEWLGSGDPFTGGARARGGGGLSPTLPDLARGLRRAAQLVAFPVWFAAASTVVLAMRRGDGLSLALGGASVAWLCLVLGMAALDFAAAPRFMVPAAATVSVLAGSGVGRALAVIKAAHGARTSRALGAVLLVVSVPFALPRAQGLVDQAAAASDRAEAQEEPRLGLARAAGGHQLLGCREATVEHYSGERPSPGSSGGP